MKYCQICGAEVNENAYVCLKCGALTNPTPNRKDTQALNPIWIVLTVLFPIVGYIYWLVAGGKGHRCANVCGLIATLEIVVPLLIVASGLLFT